MDDPAKAKIISKHSNKLVVQSHIVQATSELAPTRGADRARDGTAPEAF